MSNSSERERDRDRDRNRERDRDRLVAELEEDTQKGKYLTFALGKEAYGIEIRFVTEIIGLQPITEVPELPDYIKGIINLRGQIIPVMDVRLRFAKAYKAYNDRTCIIVIDVSDLSIGLIVDSVSEVLSISDLEIVPPPAVNKGKNKFFKGVGKVAGEVKLLLDCEQIVNENELEDWTTN
ncbi:chemotaxis protein CheW [Paenibacillus koleovorans]|uniref:chemotaxis protein CheW n=1 Tax=Paenibacillus koleovorans TaxID=121608 RepID=UPI000FD85CB1|nr:chemotaxis protein CheW [Paenibacillus koleovorans]